MSQHVHVRLNRGIAVSEEGELVEQQGCRCGATWTKTYRAGTGDPE
ncbi:hypothetical protein ACF08N_26945 [Streptomyces sp. NPDC015127]